MRVAPHKNPSGKRSAAVLNLTTGAQETPKNKFIQTPTKNKIWNHNTSGADHRETYNSSALLGLASTQSNQTVQGHYKKSQEGERKEGKQDHVTPSDHITSLDAKNQGVGDGKN
jgi:hypothetical protein